MGAAVLISVLLLLILIVFLVYWFLIRKPCSPNADCTSTVTNPDPNGTYQWDDNCSCNLVSCATGYNLTNGVCVKNSCTGTCTGPDTIGTYAFDSNCKCTLTCPSGYNNQNGACVKTGCQSGATCTVTNPDPYGTYTYGSDCTCQLSCKPPYYLSSDGKSCTQQDVQIRGNVAYEDNDNNDDANNATTLKACRDACNSQTDCKVYSFNTGNQKCLLFNDYRSVRGYGAFNDHYIDNITGDTSNSTYVKPFFKGDPEMGNGQMAYLHGAVINRNDAYATYTGYYQDLANQCLSDPNCMGVSCDNNTCKFFKDVDFVSNVVPGTCCDSDDIMNDSWTFLKMTPKNS